MFFVQLKEHQVDEDELTPEGLIREAEITCDACENQQEIEFEKAGKEDSSNNGTDFHILRCPRCYQEVWFKLVPARKRKILRTTFDGKERKIIQTENEASARARETAIKKEGMALLTLEGDGEPEDGKFQEAPAVTVFVPSKAPKDDFNVNSLLEQAKIRCEGCLSEDLKCQLDVPSSLSFKCNRCDTEVKSRPGKTGRNQAKFVKTALDGEERHYKDDPTRKGSIKILIRE